MEQQVAKRAYETLRNAQMNANLGKMASSATLAAQDAEWLFNRSEYDLSYQRSLDSLGYSVGVFHPVYAKALAQK